jgi:Family of unknown function (DUF6178)
MASAPLLPEESRHILELARKDRAAAQEAVRRLPLEAQVALVCDTPLSRRGAVLDLLAEPEKVVPLIPEAEFCFTVKAIGLSDASWMLEYASPEQIAASLDLDAWHGHDLDLATLGEWMTAIAGAGHEAVLRAARELDGELLVLWLKSRIHVSQKPAGDEDWEPPVGAQTLEGQFFYTAASEADDLDAITSLLRALFEGDYWSYFRLMQGAMWELPGETAEWALRWRAGRLQDLGFPPWEEAMSIYGFLRPEQRARIPEAGPAPLDVAEWRLPVWMPSLPVSADARHRIFRAIARLSETERRACFYAFVAVANKVAVADKMPLGDAESTPRAIEKVARVASLGLEHLASASGLEDVEVLRRVTMERLFRVGANLDPENARP